MSRYPVVAEGEWVTPRRKGYKMMCCGCGYTHKMDFRIITLLPGGRQKIQFRAFRDNRATGQARRWRSASKSTQLPK